MTLEELVKNNIAWRKAAKPGEVWVPCPWCGDEQYRMGINVITGLAHCFRASCDTRYSDRRMLFRALSELFNSTERMDDARISKIKKPKKVHTGHCSLPKEFEPLYLDREATDEIEKQALAYLESRGVTWDQIKKHKLGFCAVGDYAWRIIIPIRRKGKVISFTGRNFAQEDVDPKYKNSPGSKYMYNVPKVRCHRAILFEGSFDVWAGERAVHRWDILGRLGAGLTKKLIKDLMAYDEICLWPDPDKGGCDLASSTAVAMTKRGKKVTVVMPEDGDPDPGKMGVDKEGLQEIAHKIRHRVDWNDDVRLKLRHFAAFV